MRAAALLLISLSCMSLGAQLKDKKLICETPHALTADREQRGQAVTWEI